VGATVAFPLDKVAPGFLELDGSVKSIAVYPDLAAFLGTAFNKGDEGAGNFRLPESRGEFLRGWDHGRGVDAGREVGSYQLDALQNITGQYAANNGVQLAATGTVNGAFTSTAVGGTQIPGGAASSGVINMSFDASKVARTSTETRPRNLAVVWCVKAWNAPINQGNIDIAALAALATQATEIKLGTAKIATQAQADAGADDATIVTPKKLRWGFQIQKAANGYIVFPSWLGGLIIQWGNNTANAADTLVNFPIQFPTAPCSLVFGQNEGTLSFQANYLVNTGFKYRNAGASYPDAFTWICIGY
jgi:microcystin-dependent protein